MGLYEWHRSVHLVAKVHVECCCEEEKQQGYQLWYLRNLFILVMDAVEQENTERQKRWFVFLSLLCLIGVFIDFKGPKFRKLVRVPMPSYIEASISCAALNVRRTFCGPYRKGGCNGPQSCHQENKGRTIQRWIGYVCHP